MRDVAFTPDAGLGFSGPYGVGSCPGVVLWIEGKGAAIPFEAEGLCGSVEEELVLAHAPDAIGLWLSKEGVFGVVEEVRRGPVWVELELDERGIVGALVVWCGVDKPRVRGEVDVGF